MFVEENGRRLEGVQVALGPPWRTQVTATASPFEGGALFEGLVVGQAYEVFIEGTRTRTTIEAPAVSGARPHAAVELVADVAAFERRDGWRHYEGIAAREVVPEAGRVGAVTFERRALPAMDRELLRRRVAAFDSLMRARAPSDPVIRRLAESLRAAPLTVNFRAGALRGYHADGLLNAFQIERQHGRRCGNIVEPEWYDLRLYAEHYWFGFPYHCGRTSRGHRVEYVREWTDECRLSCDVTAPVSVTGYSAFDVDPRQRPRYAALDYRGSSVGATPDDYYGRSSMVLADRLKRESTTFTLGDTWEAVAVPCPDGALYTYGSLEQLVADALSLEIEEKKLISHLVRRAEMEAGELPPAVRRCYDPQLARAGYARGDLYVEAQLFEDVRFTDVESVRLSRSELGHDDLGRARAELDPHERLREAAWEITA